MNFEKREKSLLMIYSPEYNYDQIYNKIMEDCFRLKRTFFLESKNLSDEMEVSKEEFCFKIGVLEGGFYHLDKKIFMTDNDFFISCNVKIERKLFIANNNISIIGQIDKLVKSDIYISDKSYDISGYIPYQEYMQLINIFPNSTELKKYAQARIAHILANYIDGLGDVKEKYENYLNRRSTKLIKSEMPKLQVKSLELFEMAYETLKEMLANSDAYHEKEWQEKILEIVCILYPKYVFAKREVEIGTDGRHKKKPDFLLIDASGFVDILEIKKPDKQRVITNTQYRNNYIADRDLAGAIVQIEKYIYILNHGGEKMVGKLNEYLKEELPKEVYLKVANPQGMLLMGRSNNLLEEQKFDFEIIKRQHKNIVDIMTYDDLLERIKNIIIRLDSGWSGNH